MVQLHAARTIYINLLDCLHCLHQVLRARVWEDVCAATACKTKGQKVEIVEVVEVRSDLNLRGTLRRDVQRLM